VLELGGSDPFIVLDAEHLERTVDAAVKGRLENMGQSCVASKRFIVLHEHYDAFVSGMRDRFAALTPGDPADPATTLAPLSSERAAQALIHQVEDAAAKGATVIIGGGRPDLPGAFVEPTILTGVSPAMRAYHEELFGPVAVVHRVAGEDEAVALANDTPFGLGGSVFAADIGRAQRVAARLDAGMVWINRPAASRPELPFGGIKRSGYGRELGAAGIEEFANRKLTCAVAPDAPVGGFAGLSPDRMDVVIVGAHGKVARRLARLLVARGDRVRGVIRNPAHGDDLRADGSEPVVCDLERVGADELAGAISGADAVVFAAGAGPGSGASARSPSTATGRSSCSMRHAPRTSSGTSWSAPSAPRTRPTATTCSPFICGRRPRPTGSSLPAIAPGPSCARCPCRTSREPVGFAWPNSRSAERCRVTTSPACLPPSSTSRGPPGACFT
jgi:hypothetical protein